MKGNVVIDKIGNIFFTTSGGTPSRRNSDYYNGSIPWVKSGELKQNVILETEENITEEAIQNSSAKIFPKGTLLIALYGATIGKLAFLGVEAATNQAICGIFDNGIVSSKYTYYFLLFNKPSLVQLGAGGAQPNISQDVIKRQDFPLIPLPEQRTIVAKIEQLFSELDNGINNLKKAQEQLKVYQQAVLKKAFEGELTKAWRAKQTYLPTAKELLEQIKKKRENAAKIQGKKLKEIQALTQEELSTLPAAPNGWIRFGGFIGNIEAGKSFRCDERPPHVNEIGVAKVSAVSWGEYNELESKTCQDESKVNESFLIKAEDFLLSRANTIELVGACVIAKKAKLNVMLSDKILRINFSSGVKEFFLFYLRSRYGRLEIEKRSSGNQESMRNIGQDRIKSIAIPLFSFSEQHQIVQEIESRLSVCDKVEETIKESLEKAEALRQSILKKAFDGKLLTEAELEVCRNEPDWEPVEKLLERIKAEKGKAGKAKKKEVLA